MRTGADSERFYLREFLESPKGQCNDFSDFLCIAMHSLGTGEAAPTRSYPYAVSKIDDPYGWKLQTNPFWPARGAPGSIEMFTYHQFVLSPNLVYDGAIKVTTTFWQSPAGWAPSYYESLLVDLYWHDLNGDTIVQPNEIFLPGGTGTPWSPTEVPLTLTTVKRYSG